MTGKPTRLKVSKRTYLINNVLGGTGASVCVNCEECILFTLFKQMCESHVLVKTFMPSA